MEKLREFNDICSEVYGKSQNDVWDKVSCFLKKLSGYYNEPSLDEKKESIMDEKVGVPIKSNKATTEEESEKENGLEWGSLPGILKYIDKCKKGLDDLIEYARTSRGISDTYVSILNSTKAEFDEIYSKYREKDDIEEMKEKFPNRFSKIIKDSFFEEMIESIHKRLKSRSENSEYDEFLKRIYQYLSGCGLREKKICEGDKYDAKIARNVSPEYTDDPKLNKTIKEVIWPPYAIKYDSSEKGKYVEKLIIKGKVICYSNHELYKGEV